jgi:hypothetical protein
VQDVGVAKAGAHLLHARLIERAPGIGKGGQSILASGFKIRSASRATPVHQSTHVPNTSWTSALTPAAVALGFDCAETSRFPTASVPNARPHHSRRRASSERRRDIVIGLLPF